MNLPRVDTLLINSKQTNGKQLRTGEEAVEYLKPYFENAKTPSIHLIQLNVQCKIIRSNTISVKAFENHHREILSDLLLNNAQHVIVCDNYKNIAKSQKLSNKIKEYLKYPQIRLIDYINLPQKIHFNDMNYDEDIYYSNNDEINLNSKYIEKNIKLVEEGYLDVKSGSLSDTLDSLYEDLRKRTREEVVTLNIDEDLKPINYIVSSIGTIDRSLASSFELLKGSIMSGARNVILLHNHPSGSNYPSKGDIEMTRKVQEAYNFMGINFYDHHIVGSKVYSFKENGLLDEMRDKQSVKFEKDIKIKKNKEKGAEKKMEILNSKFNDLQLEQIRLGLEEDLDISKYADPKFSSHQMDEIQYGLSEELDISKYADPKFDWAQMREIRQGLEKDLDISHYADPKFDWEQMWEIRQGLEKGLDISQYADPKFDHSQMREIRLGLKAGLDISQYADPKFDGEQMQEIRRGLMDDIDVSKYADPKFNAAQMYEIRGGLTDGLDVSKYADPKFDNLQMSQIRLGLMVDIDVSKYADPKFNWEQMEQIIQGLKCGLDVSKYADPKFDWEQMQEIRLDSANVNIQKADINVGETVKTHEGEKYVIGKNNEKYVLFDANDKEKKYQVVENIFYDKVTQEYSWEFGETIDSLQMATNLIYNSYDDIKRSISFYCGSNHKEYFKSVMSIENSIEDENLLDNIYHEYMNNDSMQLINPDLKDLKDDASKKYDNEEETYYKHELDYERE